MNSKIISFAIEAHAKTNHLYGDGVPYSVHLAMVALYVEKYIHFVPEDYRNVVRDAAWLHDVIEDCRMTYNDVKQVAGEEVANMVYALTTEKGRNRKERANALYYEGIRNSVFARYVKMCDRLANVKYSKDTNSRMLKVYQKEHTDFIDQLIPSNTDRKKYYWSMIEELESLLANEKAVAL